LLNQDQEPNKSDSSMNLRHARTKLIRETNPRASSSSINMMIRKSDVEQTQKKLQQLAQTDLDFIDLQKRTIYIQQVEMKDQKVKY